MPRSSSPNIFTFFTGLMDLIHSLDANVVSEEGEKVLDDSEKLKTVNKAIESHKEGSSSKRIIVKFE